MPVKISSRNGREEVTLLTEKAVCWRPTKSVGGGGGPHAFNQDDQGKLHQLAQLLKLDYQTVYDSVTKKFTRKGSVKLSPVRWVKLQEELTNRLIAG